MVAKISRIGKVSTVTDSSLVPLESYLTNNQVRWSLCGIHLLNVLQGKGESIPGAVREGLLKGLLDSECYPSNPLLAICSNASKMRCDIRGAMGEKSPNLGTEVLAYFNKVQEATTAVWTQLHSVKAVEPSRIPRPVSTEQRGGVVF
tara:strand:+ start:206 stop:646 length:441 start_codon:yes stop_codon:yes gene_type:complete